MLALRSFQAPCCYERLRIDVRLSSGINNNEVGKIQSIRFIGDVEARHPGGRSHPPHDLFILILTSWSTLYPSGPSNRLEIRPRNVSACRGFRTSSRWRRTRLEPVVSRRSTTLEDERWSKELGYWYYLAGAPPKDRIRLFSRVLILEKGKVQFKALWATLSFWHILYHMIPSLTKTKFKYTPRISLISDLSYERKQILIAEIFFIRILLRLAVMVWQFKHRVPYVELCRGRISDSSSSNKTHELADSRLYSRWNAANPTIWMTRISRQSWIVKLTRRPYCGNSY